MNYLYNDKIGFIKNINLKLFKNFSDFQEYFYIFSKKNIEVQKLTPVILEFDKDILKKGKFIYVLNKKFSIEDFYNKIIRFSFVKENKLYTNLYTLLQNNFNQNEIVFIYNENYKIIQLKIPLFLYEEISNFNSINISNIENDIQVKNIKYWLPKDFQLRLKNYIKNDYGNVHYRFPLNRKDFYLWMTSEMNELLTQWILKELGYEKKIYSAAIAELKYKEFFIYGWFNDDLLLNNFLQNKDYLYETILKDINLI